MRNKKRGAESLHIVGVESSSDGAGSAATVNQRYSWNSGRNAMNSAMPTALFSHADVPSEISGRFIRPYGMNLDTIAA